MTSLKNFALGENGVIYIPSDQEKGYAVTEWTNPATRELLRVLQKQYQKFNDGKLSSKRRLFDNCSAQLQQKGFGYTSAQCENKWKSLKRRYLTKNEQLIKGQIKRRSLLHPRQMFEEEIESVLIMEKPSYKKEIAEFSKNLNIPPGFVPKTEREDETMEDENADDFENYDEEHQNDEKLVEMVLNGDNSVDEDSLVGSKEEYSNIQYIIKQPDTEEEDDDEQELYTEVKNPAENSNLTKEVRDLRKTLKRSLDTNRQIFKNHHATHEQILICLDTLDKREEEKMSLKRIKLEKQTELIQQVKIQNSLIAKLIQKLGDKSSNK